jgi:hypothetical protein
MLIRAGFLFFCFLLGLERDPTGVAEDKERAGAVGVREAMA